LDVWSDAEAMAKSRGRHKLCAVEVEAAKPRAKRWALEDGDGLRLYVEPNGSKRWAIRVTVQGKRKERGLGVYPTVKLAHARQEAERFRNAAALGRDARRDDKLASAATDVSFRSAFEAMFEIREKTLKNSKHIAQWRSTMEAYVFPKIGKASVVDVGASDILEVLKPIWFDKPETARRVLQRINATFDSAILRGTRERANPCIGVAGELGKPKSADRHHQALPYVEVPDFIAWLRTCDASPATRLALEFLILTAARSGEVREAPWSEFDLEARVWVIPKGRMKGNEEHRVPLSSRALSLLNEARALHDGDLVFPGTLGLPLSDNTLSKLMRDNYFNGTPHGFRSSFKDWCSEFAKIRDEVSESALAHKDPNSVRAAYRRTRFFEERIEVMQQWCHYLNREE